MRWAITSGIVALMALVASCGARTGLTGNGADVEADGGGGRDAGRDVEAGVHVTPPPDGGLLDCLDAGVPLVYVVTSDQVLWSFDPPTATFTSIAPLACPGGSGFARTMAVERHGGARVTLTDGRMFRVSTATGACDLLPFTGDKSRFLVLGSGYSGDGPNAATETMFVAGQTETGAARIGIVGDDFELTQIREIHPTISRTELTGNGSGDLFGFYVKDIGFSSDMFVGQFDKQTAAIIGETRLPGVILGTGGWAFAFWGGDFWLFTTPSGTPRVTRFRPDDGTVTDVLSNSPPDIVGAGVSTCAPGK